MNINVFRILGDVSHTVSKLILIVAIHSNKSAEGVSLITQALYISVFSTRYLDLFHVLSSSYSWSFMHVYNFILKLFYIGSSFYIVWLMMRVYARTREREKGWKLGAYSFAGSVVATPVVYFLFKAKGVDFRMLDLFWTYSEIQESTCVLPQLLLLRQTSVPTVIDSFYLVTLGSYRAFYVLNWIVRAASEDNYYDPTSWVFGVVQTALYLDFAWVYWTRQRVKLRGGGIVDQDDFRRGFLVSRVLGRKSTDSDVEAPEPHGSRASGESTSRNTRGGGGSWGARGISVSADEGVLPSKKTKNSNPDGNDEENAPLADPGAFEDDASDDEPATSSNQDGNDGEHVGNGAEWRDD